MPTRLELASQKPYYAGGCSKITKPPRLRGLLLFQRHPPSGRHRGGVLQGYGYCHPEGQDIQGHRQRETVALFVALQEVAM